MSTVVQLSQHLKIQILVKIYLTFIRKPSVPNIYLFKSKVFSRYFKTDEKILLSKCTTATKDNFGAFNMVIIKS